MTNTAPAAGIPAPLDTDDDDVAWALQTAAVQWKRGLYADAIVWLRRAVDAAIQIGNAQRATELNHAAADLTESMLASAMAAPPPERGGSGADVDELLGEAPAPLRGPAMGRASIDIEFDDAPPAGQMRPPPPRPISNPFLSPEPVTGGAFPTAPPTDDRPTIAEENPIDAIEEIDPDPIADDDLEPALPRFPSAPDDEAPAYDAPLPRFATDDSEPDATTPYASPPPPSVAESIPDYEPEFQVPPLPAEPLTSPGRGSMPDMVAEGALLTSEAPPPADEAAPAPEPEAEPEARIDGVALADVKGLQDLPPEAQLALVGRARIEALGNEEEVGAFAVALVLEGDVALMPTIADAACARAGTGDVVFTQGSLEEGIALRVVAGEQGARVAIWNKGDWDPVIADCPWVADDLRAVADRFQALAGAAMGALGDRFDESMRSMVTDRCDVRTLLPGEVLVEAGSTVPGMHIVGGGHVELVRDDAVEDELGPGDFLFAAQVLAGGKAVRTARAGDAGALVLFADRMSAHELLVMVPPLIEVLAG